MKSSFRKKMFLEILRNCISMAFFVLVTGCWHGETEKSDDIGKSGAGSNEAAKATPTGDSSTTELSVEDFSDEFILKRHFWGGFFEPNTQGRYSLNQKNLPISQTDLPSIARAYLWPSSQGGIAARRWFKEIPQKIIYTPFSEADSYSISEQDSRKLSTAEKYDMYKSDFDYPTVRGELERTKAIRTIFGNEGYSPEFVIPEWLDLSKTVSMVLATPKLDLSSKTLSNEAGIEVSFTRDDIVGLSAFYYYYKNIVPVELLSRCYRVVHQLRRAYYTNNIGNDYFKEEEFFEGLEKVLAGQKCDERISASGFHLTIMNEVGLNKNYIVLEAIDSQFSVESIVTGYETKYTNVTKDSVDVTLTLKLTSLETWKEESKVYIYQLVLDSNSRVIDGRWLSDGAPEYIWKSPEVATFNGYYGDVSKLVGAQEFIESSQAGDVESGGSGEIKHSGEPLKSQSEPKDSHSSFDTIKPVNANQIENEDKSGDEKSSDEIDDTSSTIEKD